MLSYSFSAGSGCPRSYWRQRQQLHHDTNGGDTGTTGSEARKVFTLPPRDERDDRKMARNAEDHAQEGRQGEEGVGSSFTCAVVCLPWCCAWVNGLLAFRAHIFQARTLTVGCSQGAVGRCGEVPFGRGRLPDDSVRKDGRDLIDSRKEGPGSQGESQEMVRRKYQREKIWNRRVSVGTHPRKEKQARVFVQRALHCDGASFACDVQVGFERTAWISVSGSY